MIIQTILTIAIPIVLVIVLVVGLFFAGSAMYKKAPPNTAMVVTGPGGAKTIIGKGCFVIPILQRVDYLSLANMQSDFTSKDEIPTKDADVDYTIEAGPTRTNYNFVGWNTAADGTGTSYSNGESVKNLAESGEVTLYAQWRDNIPPAQPTIILLLKSFFNSCQTALDESCSLSLTK